MQVGASDPWWPAEEGGDDAAKTPIGPTDV